MSLDIIAGAQDFVVSGIDLPPNVKKAMAAHDAAFEKLVEFDGENDDVLNPMFESYWEERDREAGAQAVREGRDPMALPSLLADARNRRNLAIGAREAMRLELRRLRGELHKAYMAAVPTLVAAAGKTYADAADAYEKAQREAERARSAFHAAAARRRVLAHQAHGRTAAGHLRAEAGSRGAAEVDEFDALLAAEGIVEPRGDGSSDFPPEPKVTIAVQGVAYVVTADKAAKLVRAGVGKVISK
ncbi:hypothetical protein [Streptomyces sp. NPDC088733]|uniref:hypothetical protein n=1 Tax=Streptomyces sp. NPDC088733 TaxID=3365880 RepID=UPI0038001B2E